MTAILPPGRPRLERAAALAMLAPLNIDPRFPVRVFGIRGYYDKTLGRPGNDRGLYDDAMGLIAPGFFAMFNGNTDPAAWRKGQGFGALKGMASLKPGLYYAHRLGIHRAGTKGAHRALIQTAGQVTVIRDGDPPYPDTGYFGINIHRGGVGRTNSLGCQTLPPTQWPEFFGHVERLLRQHGQTVVPYALLVAS